MTTWGQLVEGDQVVSPKNGRTYTVRASAALSGGRVRVAFEGVPKPFIKDAGESAGPVQRGPVGAVGDLLEQAFGAEVISSGTTGRKE